MDGETEEHREARIAELWKTLDTGGKGEIDFNGLRKGLRKMDHREPTSATNEMQSGFQA